MFRQLLPIILQLFEKVIPIIPPFSRHNKLIKQLLLFLAVFGTLSQEEQRICKRCLMSLLRFEEISFHRGNMGVVFLEYHFLNIHCGNIIFRKYGFALLQVYAQLWVPNLTQNGTAPSKVRLVSPSPQSIFRTCYTSKIQLKQARWSKWAGRPRPPICF